MFEFLIELFNALLSSLYDLLVSITAYLIIGAMKTSIVMIMFSWDVAKQILIDLNVSQTIAASWNQLDPSTRAVFVYLRIPEVLNIILTARVTRFVLSYIPFSGF